MRGERTTLQKDRSLHWVSTRCGSRTTDQQARNDKYVSFNNLPADATIRVYSLGGTFVREIVKSDETQFAEWDLKNQYGYPVASGLYIVRIESGSEEKILKLSLVQETQVLKYY